jgi:flagellar basal-body rod modification protein FlgD
MTSVNDVSSANSFYQSLAFDKNPKAQAQEKTKKDEFLTLLLTQAKNQDPTNPQESGEFLSQLASFELVDETNVMSKNIENLSASFISNQRLQATTLIGRQVEVNTDVAQWDLTSPVNGRINLEDKSGLVQVNITNALGENVKTISLGRHSLESVPFEWDGTNNRGEIQQAGEYKIQAVVKSSEGDQSLNVSTNASVESVSILDSGEIQLNLAGLGSVNLSSIKHIQ